MLTLCRFFQASYWRCTSLLLIMKLCPNSCAVFSAELHTNVPHQYTLEYYSVMFSDETKEVLELETDLQLDPWKGSALFKVAKNNQISMVILKFH